MALKLKDISNLPPNLPVSQIPQQVSGRSSISGHGIHHNQWTHGQSSFHPTLKQPVFHPHQRVFQNESGFEVMDDSLTDMQWLQRMDAGMKLDLTKVINKS